MSVSYTVFSGSGRNLSCGILMPSGWSVRYNTIQYNKSYAKDAWSWSGLSKLMCDGVSARCHQAGLREPGHDAIKLMHS